ncbi:MAG: uracil-DNA glycosylase [Patescibacteria group bacterium]|nr:uracil-DNA glycosylase [Patescibacteria group bacterium]
MKQKSNTELLFQVKKEVVSFTKSPLYKERVESGCFPVIGEGDHNAEIMIIGEAPGANEAKTGRPFCGRSGNLLTEMLLNIGIKRETVYITNIVKDRPPKNRDPLPEEIELYYPFLERQISIIKPKVIICLGRFSSHQIMIKFNLEEEVKPISVLHGNVFKGKADYGELKIIPLMHPAVAIYDRNKKELLEKGFLTAKQNI